MMKNTPVTKPFLPPRENLDRYIDSIYENQWLTNNGPLVRQFEQELSSKLGVKHVICVSNGTLALQIAYKALKLSGEVITTPFTFVATASSILWEGLTPRFVDISPKTLNIDSALLEESINDKTSAIVPVHVFGNPCEFSKIEEIARKHKLKVIYDAAHAFNSGFNSVNQQILSQGDVSTLSFHATKIMHSIEGGAILTNNEAYAKEIRKIINFCILGPDMIDGVGINAKMNEFQAAMGLCVLECMDSIQSTRCRQQKLYNSNIPKKFLIEKNNLKNKYNLSYMPIILDNEPQALLLLCLLEENNINARRYFYPSLDTVFHSKNDCLISRDISSRILCLPLYDTLEDEVIIRICEIVKEVIS